MLVSSSDDGDECGDALDVESRSGCDTDVVSGYE